MPDLHIRGTHAHPLQLLLRHEKAEWLSAEPQPAVFCQEDFSPPAILETCDANSEDDCSSDHEERENVFSDISTETASSVSCTEDCCTGTSNGYRPSADRDHLLAYLNYPSVFGDSNTQHLAACTMDNIFRFVVSRIPRLLLRAREAAKVGVREFISGAYLEDEGCTLLWRAMKYHNVRNEGKITVEVLRNAICDAQHIDDTDRKGASIEILGGTVWKSSLSEELDSDGWNLFYRFVSYAAPALAPDNLTCPRQTSCSGCALSVTRTFAAWSRNRQLSLASSSYASWSELEETEGEQQLRRLGAHICGGYRKGKSGALEHVKPKKKGLKCVWIERDSRNYCFLRFVSTLSISFTQQMHRS